MFLIGYFINLLIVFGSDRKTKLTLSFKRFVSKASQQSLSVWLPTPLHCFFGNVLHPETMLRFRGHSSETLWYNFKQFYLEFHRKSIL